MKQVVLLALVLTTSIGIAHTQPPQGYHWAKDGNGYFAAENGEIVHYELPAFTKTLVASKEKLTPVSENTPIGIRNFFFSNDNKQLLIYNNSKKVWRYDTRGDYSC